MNIKAGEITKVYNVIDFIIIGALKRDEFLSNLQRKCNNLSNSFFLQ